MFFLSSSFSFYRCLSRFQQEVPSKAVLEQEMVWMKEHLSSLGSPVVLCHNDLLCKNIIHNNKEGDNQRQFSIVEPMVLMVLLRECSC